MTRRKETAWWEDNRALLLPVAGLLLVFGYLLVFGIYRSWQIGVELKDPTDVNTIYFQLLTELLKGLGTRSSQLYYAITAKQVVVWGYGTGLVALALFAAAAVSLFVIYKSLQNRKAWIGKAILFAVAVALYLYVNVHFGVFDKFTRIAKQYWGLINYQLKSQNSNLNIVSIEVLIVALGYGVAMVLACASIATLFPEPKPGTAASRLKVDEIEDSAGYLSMQMKHLRLILYVGAILMVLIAFRHKMTLNWALEYLKPISILEGNPEYKFANLIYAHLDALTSNIVMATSVMNTLLLSALYVPSAFVLQKRAHALAERAVNTGATSASAGAEDGADRQDTWLKSRNLIFPFKEHLPKVIAILSPLLAGPLGDLLNFFR